MQIARTTTAMDPFLRGIIAGLVAGVLKDIPDAVLHAFHLKILAFWDYVGTVAFNQHPHRFMEHLVTLFFEVFFSIGLGVIFSLLRTKIIQTRHHLLLGLYYGGAIWLIVTGGAKLFRLGELMTHGLLEPVLTFLLSILYGLVLALVDKWLRDRYRPPQ